MRSKVYSKCNQIIRNNFSDLFGNTLFAEYPKCGATWISNMFAEAVGKKKVTGNNQLYINSVYQDHILNQGKINNVTLVFRDPRDALVSYFYYDCNVLQNSIPNIIGFSGKFELATFRKYVRMRVEKPNGISPYFSYYDFYSSWMRDATINFVRYEDFKNDTLGNLNKLCEHYGYNINNSFLKETVKKFDFENITNRKAGITNNKSHKRKGIIGDWKNHFDDDLNEYIYDKWERIFIDLGYEYGK